MGRYMYTYHWCHLQKWILTYIIWSTNKTHIGMLNLKVNWFRGKNLGHNIKNNLFTTNLRKQNRDLYWAYQLIFSLHKPITDWYDIWVMEIMTKICNICGVLIYTSLQISSVSSWPDIQNLRSYTPWNF